MFPGSNNPFQPNMIGPPFGQSQPPSMVPPGIIPHMTMPMGPQSVPQDMPIPKNMLLGQPPIYQSQGSLMQPSQPFPTPRFPVPTQSQNSVTVNKPNTTLPPGQGKDKVTKMTVDFIKQFQEQVNKRKVAEERNNRMKIQSKASVQKQTLRDDRDGSPFSDVSDTELPSGMTKQGGTEPSKGILRNRATSQHTEATNQTSTRSSNIEKSSVSSGTSSYSQKAASATPLTKPETTSTGLTAIVKNYQSESMSLTSKHRQSIPSQSDGGSGKFIPTLTRRDSRGDYDREWNKTRKSEKSEVLQDVSDDEDDLDSDHFQSQVFIGNLPINIIEADILSYLGKYRIQAWVGRHKRDKDKVCAFVKTPSMKDARTLISDIKHDRYKGCDLLVRLTAAVDFNNYKVLAPTRGRPPDPGPDKVYDSTGGQQMYYTQVPQYLPNPGDAYSMPVYLVPPGIQPTQQLFIPTGAYPIDIQAPPLQYDSRDYDTGEYESQSLDSHSRDFSPVSERQPRKFTVYVGNLPINLSMSSLEAYLTRQNHCGINLKSRDGQAYAFVDFYEYEDARNMVRDMDNKNCYGRNIHVRMADDDELGHLVGKSVQNRRVREREVERERQSKSLFQGYVDSAFANAPLLGKKYITEYLSVKELRAVYVCSVCMEMSYGSDVAEHIVGYRHRLKCFRKDQPEIYDKMCRIRDKSKMMMECARTAADNEILSEKITTQVCMDPEERAKKHLENIKDASFIGCRKSKRDSSKEKEKESSSGSSSGMDIFKRIAMHKKKLEETKKDEKKKDSKDDPKKMTFETLANKNKSLADTIVAEIASRQNAEDNVNVDAKTKETERKKEEEKQKKIKEVKQKEEDMKRRLEEARLKVIENQRKIEEDRKRKEEEDRKRKEDEKRAEEDRLRKIEEEKIKEEKRKLAEQKRKLEEEKRQLEQQKLAEAKKRALEEVKKREEEMKRKEKEKQEEDRLRKEAEEREKVALMLRMLEEEKKLEEEAKKFEEEKRIKEFQMQELRRRELQEQRMAELRKKEELEKAERLKREKFEQEKNEAEAAIKRQKQLEVLNEIEFNRRKAMVATQKRMSAMKRVEDIKKTKERDGNAGVFLEFPVIYDQQYYDKHENDLSLEQKLVQAKRKAYVSLPFSMEEKRMDLKTSIGPDEKIGPDPNSKFDAVLAMKFNLKSEQCPLIGLQYIVEGYEAISNTNHKYFCELCCVETINCDGILQHLIGFVHRRKYLEVHKAEEYAMLMQQDLRRSALNELTKQKAILIEHESGRHQIPTLSMYEFKAFVQKMKDVENAFRGLVPKVSGEATKMKELVEMSEKDDMTQADHSQYDPTINVHTVINSVLTAACEVTIEEGRTWVEFYKYLDQKKINKDTLLGLQYVTEIRGNKRYAPKYTCNLCDIKAVNWPDHIYNHLQGKNHLLKLMNFMHPEKIMNNPRLERKLSDAERTQIIQEIALEVATRRKQIESLKVGVLLVENVWRTWHEQDQEPISKEDAELEEDLKQEPSNLKPQLYDLIRHIQLPICGLQFITEIQNDMSPTVYRCSCCRSMEISQKNIIGHLRGRPHRKAFIRKTKPPNWGTIIRTDVDGYLKRRPKSADESITVKKVLYINNQGITVYTQPVVLPDPRLGLINQASKYRHQNQNAAQTRATHSKAPITPQQTTQQTTQSYGQDLVNLATVNATITEAQNPSTVTSEAGHANRPNYSKVTPAKSATIQPKVTEAQKPTSITTVSSLSVQAKQTVMSEPVNSDQSNKSTPAKRPATRFDKIVKGLDYTPLLGIEFLTEVQDEKGMETPRFECDLCNQRGLLSSLTTKNILRHIGTKGHRMTYFQRKHPEIFQVIKCNVGWEKKNVKLDRYTKEIGSKCREQIKVRIETDPVFWGKQKTNTGIKEDDDEVTIIKVETKPPTKVDPKPHGNTEPKEVTKSKDSKETKSPGKEAAPQGPLDLEQIVNETDENSKTWNEDNEKIKEKIQSGILVASSKGSKFVADYNATFCSYPIIGLQWITEFHKEDTGNWWGVCRMCEEKIENWRFISNHMSCLKHRLKYIQKKYPQIYASLKRDNITSLNVLKQKVYKHAQDIMKTEAKEFKPEVMVQKFDPNEKTTESVSEANTFDDSISPMSHKQYFVYKIKTTQADTKTKTKVTDIKSKTTLSTPKSRTSTAVSQAKTTVNPNVRSIPTLGSTSPPRYQPQASACSALVSHQWVDNCKPMWDEQLGAGRGCCGSTDVRNTRNPCVRHASYAKVRHPSHSANIELTPVYPDDNKNPPQAPCPNGKPSSTPQKRRSSTLDESDQTRKKQKLEPKDTKRRNDSTAGKADEVNKKEEQEVTDLEISSEDVRETLQMKRVEEKTELKNLKRKAKEETDIRMKTLDLKRSVEDSDDEDVKMKKSKTDHKSRSYRDSYGTSYGVDRDKKSDSRSRHSKSGDSRRKRSRSRSRSRPRHSSSHKDSKERGRSERDRHTRSKPKDDRNKSRSSKPKEKSKEERKSVSDAKDKVKEKEKIQERHEAEENESGGESDFDAFIMAQLGEDFVTVDEVEGGEEDFMTLDEVGDNANNENLATSEGDVEVNLNLSQERDSDKDKDASMITEIKDSIKDSVVDEDAGRITRGDGPIDSELKVETDISDMIKLEDKDSNVISQEKEDDKNCQKNEPMATYNDSKVKTTLIRGRMNKQRYTKTVDGELEVSVEIGEQKSSEKSNMPTKKDEVSPTSSGMNLSNIHVMVEPVPVSIVEIKKPELSQTFKQEDELGTQPGFKTEPEIQKSESSDTSKDTSGLREPDQSKETKKSVSRQPRRRNSNTASIVVEIGGASEQDSKSSGVEIETTVGIVEIHEEVKEEKPITCKSAKVKRTVKQKTSKVETVETVDDRIDNKSDNVDDESNDQVKTSNNDKEEPVKSELKETPEEKVTEVESQSTSTALSSASAKAKTSGKARQGKSPVPATKATPPARQTRSTRQSKVTSITLEIDNSQKSPVKAGSSKDNKTGRKRKDEVEVSVEIG